MTRRIALQSLAAGIAFSRNASPQAAAEKNGGPRTTDAAGPRTDR